MGLCAACRGPQVAFSPRYDFAQLKRVAVARFDGPGGTAAADLFAHSLLETGAEIVERGRLEALLREQRLSAVGALDPETVTEVGRLLGVDGLFLGSVTKYTPARSYLVYSDARHGSEDLRSVPTSSPHVSMLTSSAVVGMTARLVDVETGAVVWSAHQSYEGFDIDSAMSSVSEAFARSLRRLWRAS